MFFGGIVIYLRPVLHSRPIGSTADRWAKSNRLEGYMPENIPEEQKWLYKMLLEQKEMIKKLNITFQMGISFIFLFLVIVIISR